MQELETNTKNIIETLKEIASTPEIKKYCYSSGFHLFEYSDSMKLGASFRSFAFGGHPLANAVVISTIMNFLWITEISPIKKIQYSVLCFMALFCFNTRFAIVVTAFFF